MLSHQKNLSEMEKKICFIGKHFLGEEVIAVEQSHEGEFNQVFTLKLTHKKVILKIFNQPDFPERGKDIWLNALLSKHAIAHAKLIYYSRASRYFKYGFSLYEFVGGENARQNIETGKLTQEQFAERQARLLKKLHQIKLKKYGYKMTSDLLLFMLAPLQELKDDDWIAENKIGKEVDIGIARVQQIMSKYGDRCQPVLTHGDCAPKNTIFSPKKGDVLIDWDNCEGNLWIADLSYLLFWFEHDQVDPKIITAYEQAFFTGYGQPQDFSIAEINEIILALQIRQAIMFLPYFLLERQNMEEFQLVKRLLIKLVNIPPDHFQMIADAR